MTITETAWQTFVSENSELLAQINTALINLQPYQQLQSQYIEMMNQDKFDDAERFANERTLELVGITAWNALNPLLEEAGRKMDACGMDKDSFFG